MLILFILAIKFIIGHKLYERSNLTNPAHIDKLVANLKCYSNINPKIVTCIGFNTPEVRRDLSSQVQLPSSDIDIYGGPLNPRSHLYYSRGKPEMLFDLDYEINDSHCKDICLLSQKVIINIPNQLISSISKDQVVLNGILKQLLQFFKSNSYKKDRIYALLPRDLGGNELDLLSSYLKTAYNVNIIRNIREEALFDKEHIASEKMKTVLTSKKYTPVIPASNTLLMFNPLVCTDADIYQYILKWKEQRNFLTTSMVPILESSLIQVLHALNNNLKVQLLGHDVFNNLRSFAISDINTIIEMDTISFLYGKIVEKMVKNPGRPTSSSLDDCLEEALEYFKETSTKVLGSVSDEALKRVKMILSQTSDLILNIPPNQLIKQQLAQSKLKKGIHFGLGLTGMIRRPGRGNLQWYTNYQVGPLTFTLGFANDLDLCNSNTPRFRIQPKVHLNVNV